MLKRSHKIVDMIINVLIFIIILIILFCLYSFFSLKILQNKYVNIFGYSYFQVATGSMKDYINEGDVVIVKINSDYNEGDVVTYISGNDFVTHRVVEKNDDYIITKGDNNNTNDNPIDKSLVLGKVTKIIPNVSAIKQVLLSPKVIVLIFVTLFCLSLLFSYNGNKEKDVKESKNKKEKVKVIKEDTNKQDDIVKNDEKQIVNNEVEKKNKKKVLDATQIIDISEIKKATEKKKSKKILDATQIIDINEIKKVTEKNKTKKS